MPYLLVFSAMVIGGVLIYLILSKFGLILKPLEPVFKKIGSRNITIFFVLCFSLFVEFDYLTSAAPGRCRAQDGYLSDEKFIRAAESLLSESMASGMALWDDQPRELSSADRVQLEYTLKHLDLVVVRRPSRSFQGYLFGYFPADSWVQVQIPITNPEGLWYDACGKWIPYKDRG
ncbi:MAG: hypothetical protein ACYC3A_05485 [Halothiobacillus sp.]